MTDDDARDDHDDLALGDARGRPAAPDAPGRAQAAGGPDSHAHDLERSAQRQAAGAGASGVPAADARRARLLAALGDYVRNAPRRDEVRDFTRRRWRSRR
jgi:hypothetical protein